MPTIDATVAGANANSYETLEEAAVYFDNRIPLPTPWIASGDTSARALITATRYIEAMLTPHRVLRRNSKGDYYVVSRTWTGAPATTTQRLAWPRTGMYDRNGNAIPSNVIPQDLKDMESELAGRLLIKDLSLDNAVVVGGIKSVSAGSVSVSFADEIRQNILPEFLFDMAPASWFTDEIVENALGGYEFEVL